ncbi:MAG: hypothetical protein DRR42_23575 [Gammaproteobacteria bacterium]|nr:MAG: hypothetical protein DRR42_23575 [Gammaproteobacteria bacterium]
MYLKWFVECGMNVKFIGDNFYQHEPYTRELQNLGIEVLYGSWYANHWQDWIKENGKYLDYIYLHRPHIAPKYLDTVRKYSQAKLIYFGHDLHYLRTQRQYDIEKDAALLPAIEDWRKKEFAIFNKVDVVYYPSDIEIAEIKRQAPELTARAIPLYIFDPLEKFENTFETRSDLFFIGGFRHEPNIDALMWFTKEIFPLIVAKLPSLRLIVAGSNMPENVKTLQSSQVIIKGEISTQELEQCYRDCRVVIVPLRYGAGIKGKVLEALQYQVPVVTTDIGAEGLPGRKDYLNIANEASEFAEKVVTLYTNESRWLKVAEKGRQMINHHFSRANARCVLQQDINFNK